MKKYQIEFLDGEHSGNVIDSTEAEAHDAAEAVAMAKLYFTMAQQTHGARGYRVKDESGVLYSSKHGTYQA